MTTWHYTEDGEWPEEEQDVTISVVGEEKTKTAWLQERYTGVPGEYVPERWYYGEGGSLDFHRLKDVYAWAELPEKAPARVAHGAACECEKCKREDALWDLDDDLMPGGFND